MSLGLKWRKTLTLSRTVSIVSVVIGVGYLGCRHEVARFGFRVIRADADFDGATEGGKPSRKPVDSHAFHPTTKNLGKGGLVRAATARGLQLCELAPLDRFVNRLNESAFRCELRRFCGGEPDISEDVYRCFCEPGFQPFSQSSASSARARLRRASINSASGFGIPIPDFDFFMKACST